jgi:Glycosyl transferase family 11
MSRKDKFLVEIQGGLGNQLFGLAFAQYLSQQQNRDYAISERQFDRGITKHGVRIAEFDMSAEYLDDQSRSYLIERIVNKARREASRILGRDLNVLSNTYFSRTIGFDPKAEVNIKKRYVGYFQSYIYAEALRGFLKGQTLNPRVTTDWFKNKQLEALDKKPIMLHVRRGDYLLVKNDFGVLGLDYYERALQTLYSLGLSGPIWIFSDSPEIVEDTFTSDSWRGAEIVKPPIDSAPAESLSLMQFGIANVISNSTFSWWPAFLSPHNNGIVVAPEEWFSGMDTPEKLVPEEWIKIKSSWE